MSKITKITIAILALAVLAAWTHGSAPVFGFLLDNASVILTTDTGDDLVGT